MNNDRIKSYGKVIQTYVWHNGKCFFISTINRQSSAIGELMSAETLAWEWDNETNKRGAWIGQDEDCEDSIATHQQMVERLFRTGKCEEIENE
jgi:hypothetical protein